MIKMNEDIMTWWHDKMMTASFANDWLDGTYISMYVLSYSWLLLVLIYESYQTMSAWEVKQWLVHTIKYFISHSKQPRQIFYYTIAVFHVSPRRYFLYAVPVPVDSCAGGEKTCSAWNARVKRKSWYRKLLTKVSYALCLLYCSWMLSWVVAEEAEC